MRENDCRVPCTSRHEVASHQNSFRPQFRVVVLTKNHAKQEPDSQAHIPTHCIVWSMLNWHNGHTLLSDSHASTHCLWYEWKHGSDLTLSPSRKVLLQIKQLQTGEKNEMGFISTRSSHKLWIFRFGELLFYELNSGEPICWKLINERLGCSTTEGIEP